MAGATNQEERWIHRMLCFTEIRENRASQESHWAIMVTCQIHRLMRYNRRLVRRFPKPSLNKRFTLQSF